MAQNESDDGVVMSDVESMPLGGGGIAAPGAIAGNIPQFNSKNEEVLAQRYGKPERKQEELTFEYTLDPALVHQYRCIYEKEFRAVYNIQNYRELADEHDRRASFLIIRQGNLCIGGARLWTKTPRQPGLLPMESGDFRIENHFPHLKQKELTYGQVGRICLLPEFRGGDVTRRMFWHIHRKAVSLNWEVIFATATVFNSRMIKKHCLAIGLKDTKILHDIEVPPYPLCEEVKMYFMSIGIDKSIVAAGEEPVLGQKAWLEENIDA